VWTDAEIEWYFKYTRDAQYLVDSERPNCTFLRRISWQYPYMGCQQRAEQANGLIADTGKQKPYKLFAFGELHVITDNHPNGYVDWAWHVVPVVRRSTGEPIVFDAAINPCRPLNWKEWLAQMTMDINNFDDVAGGWGVTVANANAYTNMSDPVNEPSHREDSKFDLQNAILDWEWHVQETLLRDPNEVLNTNPPWANKACEKIVMNFQRIDVEPNTNITIVTRCPFGTLVLGGGFVPYADTFLIYKNARNGNGWEISARNTSTSSQGLFVDVDCLVDPPSNAFVSTVTSSKVTIARNAYNSATASCSSGKLIGGGFLTTLGNPAAIMKIYNHGRTTSKGNTWRVSAYNTTTGSRNLTSYAYCLQNANVSVTQTSANVTGSDGYAIATCPSSQLTMGGGFTFPRTAAYSVLRMWNDLDNTYRVQFYPFPTGGNAANSYSCAQCMTKP